MAYVFPGESEDIEVMLGDSPHSITAGGVTGRCFYEVRSDLGEETAGAAGRVLDIELATVASGRFPALREGDPVTISDDAGTQRQYVVIRIMASGPMRELMLQREE